MSASVPFESKDSHTVVLIHWCAIVAHVKATKDSCVKLCGRAIADKLTAMGSDFERLILSDDSTLDIFSQGRRTMTWILYLFNEPRHGPDPVMAMERVPLSIQIIC